jgi:hypothetical protein
MLNLTDLKGDAVWQRADMRFHAQETPDLLSVSVYEQLNKRKLFSLRDVPSGRTELKVRLDGSQRLITKSVKN